MRAALLNIIMDHTRLGDPPRFDVVAIAQDAYALGRRNGRGDARTAIESLCEAAFLAGANPDNNKSRHYVDRAIAAGKKFLASADRNPKGGNEVPSRSDESAVPHEDAADAQPIDSIGKSA
jgi:hypothetical protein